MFFLTVFVKIKLTFYKELVNIHYICKKKSLNKL